MPEPDYSSAQVLLVKHSGFHNDLVEGKVSKAQIKKMIEIGIIFGGYEIITNPKDLEAIKNHTFEMWETYPLYIEGNIFRVAGRIPDRYDREEVAADGTEFYVGTFDYAPDGEVTDVYKPGFKYRLVIYTKDMTPQEVLKVAREHRGLYDKEISALVGLTDDLSTITAADADYVIYKYSPIKDTKVEPIVLYLDAFWNSGKWDGFGLT